MDGNTGLAGDNFSPVLLVKAALASIGCLLEPCMNANCLMCSIVFPFDTISQPFCECRSDRSFRRDREHRPCR